jgi:hypothetical protein
MRLAINTARATRNDRNTLGSHGCRKARRLCAAIRRSASRTNNAHRVLRCGGGSPTRPSPSTTARAPMRCIASRSASGFTDRNCACMRSALVSDTRSRHANSATEADSTASGVPKHASAE